MSDDIPYATPYPWDNPTMEDSQKYANEKLRKRRFVGSGLAALRKNAFGPEATMGDVAKNMLMNLLQQHNIEIGGEGDDFETEADELYGDSISGLNREPLVPDTAENELLGLARSGRLSLFSSLLKVVEDAESSVTTKNLLRHCSMTLRPGDVPGSLDAKEFVLSALHFLSSKFEASSDQLLPLPLIQPIQEVGDLEKRSYEKAGEWKLDEIKDNLLRLEQIFISSPSSWRWLKRETFSPRLPQNDEISFFLKGSIPASATAKKTKGETSRKRKAAPSSPPAGGSPSPVRDSSAFESTPVVEATIVAEGSPTNSIA
jgi:hypothetical protein